MNFLEESGVLFFNLIMVILYIEFCVQFFTLINISIFLSYYHLLYF
jgi:hypothetical protein